MAAVTWFSGWEPTELLPWSLGSSSHHVLQREPFPSWNSCLLCLQHNQAPSPLPARARAPPGQLCSEGREKQCSLQYLLRAHIHCIVMAVPACVLHIPIRGPSVLPPPQSFLKQMTSVQTVKYNPATRLVFLFQYRIASEKIPKICLEVILLPFLQA